MADTHRDMALRGEVVIVTLKRLKEMQQQAVQFEGVTAEPVYHWHWAAIINELIALRRECSLLVDSQSDAADDASTSDR